MIDRGPLAALGEAAPSILVATELNSASTGAGLVQGFRALGWDVGEVELRDAQLLSRDRTLRAISRLSARLTARSYNDAILREADRLGPHAFLSVKGVGITAQTLRSLRDRGIFTINFYPDYKFEYTGFDPTLFDEYALTITTKSFQLPWLRDRLGADRVGFVHHGYVPDAHRRRVPVDVEPNYLWDVAYVGNASPHKCAWLMQVAEQLDGRSMIVVGNGWHELARGTALAPHVLGGPLVGDHFARIVEHSRINIALHFGKGGGQGWEDLVSTRTFEIPACGGFMLHIDNPEIRSLYEVPGEIDTFTNAAELVAKIRHYLRAPVERRAMIERAWRRAVPAYGLTARAAEIDAILKRHGLPTP